jgi:hypothetical protein
MWEDKHPDAVASPHMRAHPETIGWCYFAAARVRAQRGDGEAALGHLHRALDEGWQDQEQLRQDEGLEELRGLQGWKKLAARL